MGICEMIWIQGRNIGGGSIHLEIMVALSQPRDESIHINFKLCLVFSVVSSFYFQ
jgi:hypothetical protein